MAHPILMPRPGQMTEECVLTLWRKEEGEPVHRGDVLFEIETDKSTMEVESFEEGVLLKRLVAEGETVPVNTVCAWVGAPGEAIPEPEPRTATVSPAGPDEAGAIPTATPAAASAAASAVAAPALRPPAPQAGMSPTAPRISPRASRLAAAAGLDPRSLTGTGPGGRIVERDVQAAIAARAEAASSPPSPPSPSRSAVVGEEEPRPLSRMRRVIAERLTLSFSTVPHFTVTVATDATRLLAVRQTLKEAGTSLTVTDFVLAATAQSLVEFPDVNSRTDGTVVWPRRRVHLGVAVSVPGGLVVPVIRDADQLGIGELHERASALVAAARAGTLSVDDMTGGTFTVSNLGMLGVEAFSAIINPGEAAILAVASAIDTPVVINGGIAIRAIMRLTLSADHRLVDGELGARFLNAVRRRLEDPEALRRELANA